MALSLPQLTTPPRSSILQTWFTCSSFVNIRKMPHIQRKSTWQGADPRQTMLISSVLYRKRTESHLDSQNWRWWDSYVEKKRTHPAIVYHACARFHQCFGNVLLASWQSADSQPAWLVLGPCRCQLLWFHQGRCHMLCIWPSILCATVGMQIREHSIRLYFCGQVVFRTPKSFVGVE